MDNEGETDTELLQGNSTLKDLGDPMDVELNQNAGDLSSEGKNAPTVSVTAESKKDGIFNRLFHEKVVDPGV